MNNFNAIDSTKPLGQEWMALQTNYEQYETSALLIKLVAIVLTGIGWVLGQDIIAIALIAVLWMQEGIFKTYQSRLGERLLRVETLIKRPDTDPVPFQLHTDWLAGRRGIAHLLTEYAASAARPTVAFPYAALMLLLAAHVLAWLS